MFGKQRTALPDPVLGDPAPVVVGKGAGELRLLAIEFDDTLNLAYLVEDLVDDRLANALGARLCFQIGNTGRELRISHLSDGRGGQQEDDEGSSRSGHCGFHISCRGAAGRNSLARLAFRKSAKVRGLQLPRDGQCEEAGARLAIVALLPVWYGGDGGDSAVFQEFGTVTDFDRRPEV